MTGTILRPIVLLSAGLFLKFHGLGYWNGLIPLREIGVAYISARTLGGTPNRDP